MATNLAGYAGESATKQVPYTTWSDFGQSFTTIAAGDATVVRLKGYRVGSPGTLTVNIYASDGDFPDGASLGSGTLNTATISTSTVGATFDITISSTTLANTTKYVFTLSLSAGTPGSDYLVLKCAQSAFGDVYSGGEAIYYDTDWNDFSPASVALYFYVIAAAVGHAKTSNPTPANDATGVDFSGFVFDWDGNGTVYDIYFGESGSLQLVSSALSTSTYTTSLAELEQYYEASPIDQKIYWRVDSTFAGETLTGDEWNFDPRPAQATNPTPANAATDIGMEQDFSWDAVDYTDTYDLVLSDDTISAAQAGVTFSLDDDYWGWSEEVTWRVDSTNQFGTTTGTEWTFTALDLEEPQSSYTLITGGSGNGPDDGGVEGTDFWWTGLNNGITVKRLVAFGRDRVFLEEIN